MVGENTYYILLNNKTNCLILSFKLKDLKNKKKKSEKTAKKLMFLKIFLKIEAGHVLNMFLNFGQY